MVKISRYLTQVLKLKVKREKSRVVKVEDLNYLGFTFRGIRIFASDAAMQAFKHRLRGLTSRSWGSRWQNESKGYEPRCKHRQVFRCKQRGIHPKGLNRYLRG
jgi:hypothetical protein